MENKVCITDKEVTWSVGTPSYCMSLAIYNTSTYRLHGDICMYIYTNNITAVACTGCIHSTVTDMMSYIIATVQIENLYQ